MGETWREKIGFYFLNRKIKNVKRSKSFHNFDSAKSVGLIFSAIHQESYLQAKSFTSFLTDKGIDVYSVAYAANKEMVAYFPYHKGVHFFSIKDDVNWFFAPKNAKINEFIERPLDMLVDLSVSENLTIQYIIALSQAKFKVARTQQKFNYSDFMIDIQKNPTPAYFLEQVKLYMSLIHKK